MYIVFCPLSILSAILMGTASAGILYVMGADLFNAFSLANLFSFSSLFVLAMFSIPIGFSLLVLIMMKRGLGILAISAHGVRIKNGLGMVKLELKASADQLLISRRNESYVEVRVRPDTKFRRAMSETVKFLYWVLGPGSVWTRKEGLVSYLIVASKSLADEKSKSHLLMPDMYRWNKKAYRQLIEWCESNRCTVKIDKDLEDKLRPSERA